MYNGLQNDMTSFAKFAFIFEKEIKANVKNEEFKSRFKTAFELYEHKVKCHVRYVKQKDIATITDYAKFTLFFTKKRSQVLDFCRHLRNSLKRISFWLSMTRIIDRKFLLKDIWNIDL